MMDPMSFDEMTGTNEREPMSQWTGSLPAPQSVAPPDCSVCELPHPIGTPHPERIHPGPRTVKVRAAAVHYADGSTVIVSQHELLTDESALRVAGKSTWRGRILGRCFVKFDIPLDEVPVIEGRVEEAKREGGEKL